MAKVIVAWCDPHMAADEQVPGRSFQISLDGKKPVEVDLCEQHEKEFLTPLMELLGEVGQPVDKPLPGMPKASTSSGDATPKAPCPTCQKSMSREGLRKHMMNVHGVERLEAGDIVRAAFGSVHEKSVKVRECPECKAEGASPEDYEFDTPQGLGAHRRTVHGVAGTNTKAAKKKS